MTLTSFYANNKAKTQLILGDSQNMSMLRDNSIDFICTHPPYADIIRYSNDIKNDLSTYDYNQFLFHIDKVSKELYRVLKSSHYCSFMIGDIRKKGNVIPLGFKTMQIFINNNFILKETIIKKQHNCTSTIYWKEKYKDLNFYLLAHEYIFVFYKI